TERYVAGSRALARDPAHCRGPLGTDTRRPRVDFAPVPHHRPHRDAGDEALPRLRSATRPLGVRSASREPRLPEFVLPGVPPSLLPRLAREESRRIQLAPTSLLPRAHRGDARL